MFKKSSTFAADFDYICACVHTRGQNKQKYNKTFKIPCKNEICLLRSSLI